MKFKKYFALEQAIAYRFALTSHPVSLEGLFVMLINQVC